MARPGPRGRPRVGWLPLLAALLGILMLAITPSAALTTDPVQPPSPDQANRLRQLWSDPDWVRQVQPRIGVQAFLSNGGGVKGRSAETAHHVVVSVNGVDPDTKAPVQWPCGQVTMHAQAPGISLELEDGDVEREGFRTVELGSDPQSFMLNGLGHVSFTLPAKYQSMTEESMLPLLYVRMQFMPAGQWVVAHIDLHAQALLKNVEPQHFIAANPQLSEAIAFMASQATKHYMTELQHASVAESRKVRRYRRDNNLHRGEAVPDVKVPAHRLTVDLERHWISTYTVHEAEAPRVRLVRRDALAQAHSGTPVEEQAKDLLLQFEGSPDDAVARETGLASYKMYRTQISNHLVTADDEHHGLLGTVLTGVAHIWQARWAVPSAGARQNGVQLDQHPARVRVFVAVLPPDVNPRIQRH
ncbi:hypothetical protein CAUPRSCDRAFT_10911 [Caulochytrium protostelioides]|uniref:Uncharacterized protein n=1 Tax=Caulochytrium protostelioides TaxID=1555241 RepID=A0A4V1ITK9_9FUNG|nr:hypothetical protein CAUPRSCDRAFT_10911 [Caulochytrium protostelioides]